MGAEGGYWMKVDTTSFPSILHFSPLLATAMTEASQFDHKEVRRGFDSGPRMPVLLKTFPINFFIYCFFVATSTQRDLHSENVAGSLTIVVMTAARRRLKVTKRGARPFSAGKYRQIQARQQEPLLVVPF